MRVTCCSVCQNKYDEEQRCPLLLQCGHGFCRDCLSKMFAASPDSSLSCPRCRHVSTVGNSVSALKKNYAILSLIQGGDDEEDDDDDEDDDEEEDGNNNGINYFVTSRSGNYSSCSGNNGGVGCNGFGSVNSSSSKGGSRRVADSFREGRIDMVVHKDVKMVKRIGEGSGGRSGGVETWAGVVSGKGCKHKVAVKKVPINEEMNVVWMQGQLDELRRKSMWCRNVCTFHGVTRVDSRSLCLVMDRCHGSVRTAMQMNEGRLTLEQILRFCVLNLYILVYAHVFRIIYVKIFPWN